MLKGTFVFEYFSIANIIIILSFSVVSACWFIYNWTVIIKSLIMLTYYDGIMIKYIYHCK